MGILLCASFLYSRAQTTRPISKIYLQGDAGGGTYKSSDFGFGLRAIIYNKWSITLSYKDLEMKPRNLPSDYQPEIGYVFFIYTDKQMPQYPIVFDTMSKCLEALKKKAINEDRS